MKIKLYLFFFIISSLFIGCSITQISNQNLSYIYETKLNLPTAQYIVFHKSDTCSTLYYKINTSNFLYTKPAGEDKYFANIKLKYELFESFESKQIIDSNSVNIKDSTNYKLNYVILDSLNFKAIYNKNYLLKIILTDINKKTSSNTFINISKGNYFNRQNFIVKTVDDSPLFSYTIDKYTKFKITYRDTASKKLYVNYYNRTFPIALPPFALSFEPPHFVYKADSTFIIDLSKGKTNIINLSKQGFYHFRTDTTVRYGLTLFRFYNGFPKTRTPKHLLEPLRYLTTQKEYNKFISSRNKKLAVDNFWIENSGNPDRATKMIKKFYNRVQDANILFSSYLEGWKTDKGIIYIIYGPPNVVYKTSDTETWIYGVAGNMRSINFNFIKIDNPFADNDYFLNRVPALKDSWYKAVEIWRR